MKLYTLEHHQMVSPYGQEQDSLHQSDEGQLSRYTPGSPRLIAAVWWQRESCNRNSSA